MKNTVIEKTTKNNNKEFQEIPKISKPIFAPRRNPGGTIVIISLYGKYPR